MEIIYKICRRPYKTTSFFLWTMLHQQKADKIPPIGGGGPFFWCRTHPYWWGSVKGSVGEAFSYFYSEQSNPTWLNPIRSDHMYRCAMCQIFIPNNYGYLCLIVIGGPHIPSTCNHNWYDIKFATPNYKYIFNYENIITNKKSKTHYLKR